MDKLKRIGLRLLKVFVLLIGLYVVLVSLPWSCGICSEENIGQAFSPDGKYLARAYVRNCGATTGYLTHVNFRPRWTWFNPDWVGTIKQNQVFANSCWSRIDFVWRDNAHLDIQYEKCAPRENGRD